MSDLRERSVENLRPVKPGESSPALRHGAYSSIRLGPRAAEIADELRAIVPARGAADEPTIALAALALAQVEAASLYVAERGIVDGRGRPQPILRHLGTMMNTASRLLAALGCSPTSRAALGVDLVRVDDALVAHLAEGRAIRERREAEDA